MMAKKFASGCRNLSASQFLTLRQERSLFQKEPEIALELIDRSLKRGYRPGIVLMDAGYGNNTNFLKGLESRRLKYLGAVAKNRKNLAESIGRKLAKDSP